jgi:DinB superfamily
MEMLSQNCAENIQRPASIFASISRLFALPLILAIMAVPMLAQETKTTPKMTEKDRELAIAQLNASREKFIASVSGLSEAQLKFKSAPDRWSIAEVAEHITLSEDFLFGILTDKALKSPLTPDKERKLTDEQILGMVTNRGSKFPAPDPLKPAGKWSSMAETMQEFDKRRARTTELVKTTKTDLRSHFIPFGSAEIDALQWTLFLSGHCERHTAQINEVKADPNFPKK